MLMRKMKMLAVCAGGCSGSLALHVALEQGCGEFSIDWSDIASDIANLLLKAAGFEYSRPNSRPNRQNAKAVS